MTHVYSFLLPRFTNAGIDYAPALQAWEAEALALAGGFTSHASAVGAWTDPEGDTILDRLVPYDVATTAGIADYLLERAFALFPDQSTIYRATGTEATTHHRVDHVAASPSGDGPGFSLERAAADVSDALKAHAQPYNQAAWAIDSVLSLLRRGRADGAPRAAIAALLDRFDRAFQRGRDLLRGRVGGENG